MADDDDDEPTPPPLTVRMELILRDVEDAGRQVVEFAVCPLTWLDLCEELCPDARCLTDIVGVKWRGIPVKRNLHPHAQEDIVYFVHVGRKPGDLAVTQRTKK